MTEHSARTGALRDVPAPRPVAPPPAPVEETGLGRAARAVADAVTGLVGGTGAAEGPAAGEAPPRTGLRDVLGAVATAVGAAVGGNRAADPPPPPDADPPAEPGRSPGAVLGDLLSAAAPRLPVRDRARLRAAHPGASDAEIADALIARAARLTAGIGAATGGLSAAHWFAPPSLLAVPLELGAETVLTAAVEVVLIGELHELHGRPAPGDARARGAAYLSSWSAQRSVQTAGLGSVLGAAGLRALRRRMGRRLVRTVPTAAPLLLGAALAGRGNRRATETLAARVLRDLRGGT
ncbi:hypothetical protein JKP75_11795 [Blastococcus sp. TML/M2B]|uniref:hypothetical protein n=1 Tax=unclassified Blastococcus TaxID=2619396 RepID=UPI0019098F73|nr:MULTISPECIES: hypothetical protein [unclassified Blastococcus]MBN1093177.1 hypothetical protein [Blastococcus sp. TML/M2B]MBN1096708.1 hypothetical protein [Blastococcus sp. TML/C7B]